MKCSKLFLLSTLLVPTIFFATLNEKKLLEVKGDSISLNDILAAKPGTVDHDFSYDVVAEVHFNKSDIGYVDISDSATSTIVYEYGFEEKELGSAIYLESPGGGFDTLLRCRTNTNTDISTTDGLLFYTDLSDARANSGNYVGVGVGLMLMDSKTEPPSGSNMWNQDSYNGHFRHYYPLKNKTAYYYDIFEGRFVPSTIINKCVTVPEGYQGWVYIPWTSYSWNADVLNKYVMNKDAFDNGFNWVNYSHLLTNNLKDDDTQARIYFDELNFIKKIEQKTLIFDEYGVLSPTCHEIGANIYLDSETNNYTLREVTPMLEHDYNYYPFKQGAIGICSRCGEAIYIKEKSSVTLSNEIVDTSDYVDIHFYYGSDYENEDVVIVKTNESVSKNKEPRINRINKKEAGFAGNWDYDFSCWSSSKDTYAPKNPKTSKHLLSSNYYAKYLISSYDNVKYSHVTNILAMRGGRYNSIKGQIIMNGNSNFALAYNTTTDFANRGLPILNNSVAGASSYDYYFYSEQLAIGFDPKILLFNLTTNDQAYWSMSEINIINLTKKFIEKVHSNLPNCEIAVVNASPLPGRSEMFATINRVNNAMKEYANTLDYIHYIDTYDFVYERMLEYPNGWEFWTHMDTETLSTWMNLIADGLIKIVNEKGIVF